MTTASQSFEPRVTIADLVTAMGVNPSLTLEDFIATFVKDAGLVAPDWAGRASVSIRTAALVRSAHLEGIQRQEAEQADYAASLDERNRRRREKVDEAFEKELRLRRQDPLRDRQMIGVPMARDPVSVTIGSAGRPITVEPQGVVLAKAAREAEAQKAAREKAAEAAERFDRHEPELSIEEWRRKAGRR